MANTNAAINCLCSLSHSLPHLGFGVGVECDVGVGCALELAGGYVVLIGFGVIDADGGTGGGVAEVTEVEAFMLVLVGTSFEVVVTMVCDGFGVKLVAGAILCDLTEGGDFVLVTTSCVEGDIDGVIITDELLKDVEVDDWLFAHPCWWVGDSNSFVASFCPLMISITVSVNKPI